MPGQGEPLPRRPPSGVAPFSDVGLVSLCVRVCVRGDRATEHPPGRPAEPVPGQVGRACEGPRWVRGEGQQHFRHHLPGHRQGRGGVVACVLLARPGMGCVPPARCPHVAQCRRRGRGGGRLPTGLPTLSLPFLLVFSHNAAYVADARTHNVPVVSEEYLHACIAQQKKLVRGGGGGEGRPTGAPHFPFPPVDHRAMSAL
jgi:hypothetical protein